MEKSGRENYRMILKVLHLTVDAAAGRKEVEYVRKTIARYRRIYDFAERGSHCLDRSPLGLVHRVHRSESFTIGFHQLVPDDYDFKENK